MISGNKIRLNGCSN